LPDDPRHFVAVELDNRVLHLDLGHASSWFLGSGAALRRAPTAGNRSVVRALAGQ
jgi:hypothetical protein